MSIYPKVVTIFVGRTGAQISSPCWDLLRREHRICADGFKPQESLDKTFHSFFAPLRDEIRFTPRTIIVDLEPTAINEIKTGVLRNFFNPSSLIAGKEDAADNFAKGYLIGRETIDLTLERIRITCEKCSNLNAFMIFRSLSGGTGSGFGTLLFERLADDYGKKLKLDFAVYPAPNISSIILEPYNFVLTTHGTMEYRHCCFAVDNEALSDICVRKLYISVPSFKEFNRLHAQIVSGITTPMRFACAKSMRLQELLINLIPYPRMHTLLTSYAPIVARRKVMYSDLNVENITNECFEPTNHMLKCDPRIGVYMGCCLLYRGVVNDYTIRNSIASLRNKRSIRVLPLNPIGITIGVNYQLPVTFPDGDLADSTRIVTNLSNNTTIRHTLFRLVRKFDLMYKKKAFFHHYIAEGMDEDLFNDARDNISALLDEYVKIEE